MAEIIKSENGFTSIKMTSREIMLLKWGFQCNKCEEPIKTEFYYIGVLNDLMCKSCYEKFISTHNINSEDKKYQDQNIDSILSLLEYKEKSNSLKFAIVNEERETIIFKGRKELVLQHYSKYWSNSNFKVVVLEGKYLKYIGANK